MYISKECESLPKKMELDSITVQDCVEKYQFRNMCAILHNGEIHGFKEEEKE